MKHINAAAFNHLRVSDEITVKFEEENNNAQSKDVDKVKLAENNDANIDNNEGTKIILSQLKSDDSNEENKG